MLYNDCYQFRQKGLTSASPKDLLINCEKNHDLNPNSDWAAVGKVWKNNLPKEEGSGGGEKMCIQGARWGGAQTRDLPCARRVSSSTPQCLFWQVSFSVAVG